MFAYCLNNPANATDPTGHDSSTDANGNGIPDYLEHRWIELTNRYKANSNIIINAEKTIHRSYYFLITVEDGVGYNKSFNNNKKTNFFISISNCFLNGFPISAGADLNNDGYGAAIEIGTNVACSIHMNEDSFEIGWDPAGHSYFKHTYTSANGTILFDRVSINSHELGATILAIYYAPQAIVPLVYAFTKMAEAFSY